MAQSDIEKIIDVTWPVTFVLLTGILGYALGKFQANNRCENRIKQLKPVYARIEYISQDTFPDLVIINKSGEEDTLYSPENRIFYSR